MPRSALLTLAALTLAPLLHAAEMEGVKMPDSVSVAGTKLVLNGLGMREATFLKVDVYVAGMYLEKKTASADAIRSTRGAKKLLLKFVRDVEKKDIAKAWTEGFKNNAKAKQAALQARIDKLNGWMATMKKGQSMSFTELPGKGIEIEVNGKVKGVIEGDDFAEGVWAIYFGPKPPNPGLKKGLLGKG